VWNYKLWFFYTAWWYCIVELEIIENCWINRSIENSIDFWRVKFSNICIAVQRISYSSPSSLAGGTVRSLFTCFDRRIAKLGFTENIHWIVIRPFRHQKFELGDATFSNLDHLKIFVYKKTVLLENSFGAPNHFSNLEKGVCFYL